MTYLRDSNRRLNKEPIELSWTKLKFNDRYISLSYKLFFSQRAFIPFSYNTEKFIYPPNSLTSKLNETLLLQKESFLHGENMNCRKIKDKNKSTILKNKDKFMILKLAFKYYS